MYDQIEEIIKKTVNTTILELKREGLLVTKIRSTYRKTEDFLRNYNAFSLSDDPKALQMISKIEKALSYIKDDPYYETVTLYYIGGWSREDLAEKYNSTITTITRNKSRLVRKLSIILFADEYIKEAYEYQEPE